MPAQRRKTGQASLQAIVNGGLFKVDRRILTDGSPLSQLHGDSQRAAEFLRNALQQVVQVRPDLEEKDASASVHILNRPGHDQKVAIIFGEGMVDYKGKQSPQTFLPAGITFASQP